MKFIPTLSIPFGKFSRDLSREEAAEILKRSRGHTSTRWHRWTGGRGMWAHGTLILQTRPI